MPEPTDFYEHILQRAQRKENYLLAIIGRRTGIGKSRAGIRICEEMSKKLGVPFGLENIIFTFKDFLNILPKLMSNSFILMDDAGLALGNREFGRLINRLANMTYQSFRFKYIHTIFTMPNLSYLDVAERKLLHEYIRIDRKAEPYTYGKLYELWVDDLTGKLGRKGIMDELRIEKSDDDFFALYEQKKADIMNTRYEEFRQLAEREELSLNRMTPKQLAKYIMQDEQRLKQILKDGEPSYYKIMWIYDLAVTKAAATKRMIEFTMADPSYSSIEKGRESEKVEVAPVVASEEPKETRG